jgi:hypothetical protein
MPVAVSLRSCNMRMYQWYGYLWKQWIQQTVKKKSLTTPSRHIREEVQLHPFLISGLDGRVVNIMPRSLYALEITLVPNEKRAEWPQSRSGHFGEGTNLLLLPGYEHCTVQPEA